MRIRDFVFGVWLIWTNGWSYLAHFREILHKAIKAGLREDVDAIQRNGALQLQQGWMHINGAFSLVTHTPLLLIE